MISTRASAHRRRYSTPMRPRHFAANAATVPRHDLATPIRPPYVGDD